jgi:hypothetical protein
VTWNAGDRCTLDAEEFGQPKVDVVAGPNSMGRYMVALPSGATLVTEGVYLYSGARFSGYVRVARYSDLKNGNPAPPGSCHRCNGRIGRGETRAKCDIGLRGAQTSGGNGRGVFVCVTCDEEMFDPPIEDPKLFKENTQ